MIPSIQVKLLQADWVSVPLANVLIVKSRVITESQPATDPPEMVKVGVFVLDVYVMPSIQVKLLQADWVSVPLAKLLMVRLRVMMESHPATDPPGIVKVGVLVEDV